MCKRGFERAVQGLDLVSHIDLAKILAPEALEPRGGNSPCFVEGAQLDFWIASHMEYIV